MKMTSYTTKHVSESTGAKLFTTKAKKSGGGEDFVDVRIMTSHESKDDEEERSSGKLTLLGGLNKLVKQKGMRLEVDLVVGGAFSTNTAGSFRPTWAGGTTWAVSNVTSATEWASFGAVFDEIFVKEMVIQYQPNNCVGGGIVAASSATNLNSCALSLFALQHSAADYADSSTAFATCLEAQGNKFVNTGKPWTFKWKNIEKFDWKAPIGTAAAAQTWAQISGFGYGGFVGGRMPFATNASPTSILWPASTNLGVFVCRFKVAYRARS